MRNFMILSVLLLTAMISGSPVDLRSRQLSLSTTVQVSDVYGHQAATIQCPNIPDFGRWMSIVGGWPWSADITSSDMTGVWARDACLWDLDSWTWVDGSTAPNANSSYLNQWFKLFPSMPETALYTSLMANVHHRQFHTLTPITVNGLDIYVLFGGYRNGNYLNDSYSLYVDCESSNLAMAWQVLSSNTFLSSQCSFSNFYCSPSLVGPDGRGGHADATVQIEGTEVIILMGGMGNQQSPSHYYADIWILQISGDAASGFMSQWSLLETPMPSGSDGNPRGLAYHSLSPYQDGIYMWGGQGDSLPADIDATATLNSTTMTWSSIESISPISLDHNNWCGNSLWGHVASIVKQSDLVVGDILTGSGTDQTYLNEDRVWMVVYGGYCPSASPNVSGYYNRFVLVLDLLVATWTASPTPANISKVHLTRLSFETAMDSLAVMFGGDSGTIISDINTQVMHLNSMFKQNSLETPANLTVVDGNQIFPAELEPCIATALIADVMLFENTDGTLQVEIIGANLTAESSVEVNDVLLLDLEDSTVGTHVCLIAYSNATYVSCVSEWLPAGYYEVMIQKTSQSSVYGSIFTVLWAQKMGYACLRTGFGEIPAQFSTLASTNQCVQQIGGWSLTSQTTSSLSLEFTNSVSSQSHIVAFDISLQSQLWNVPCFIAIQSSKNLTCMFASQYDQFAELITVAINVSTFLSGTRWIDSTEWTAEEVIPGISNPANTFSLGGHTSVTSVRLTYSDSSSAVNLTGSGLDWSSIRWSYALITQGILYTCIKSNAELQCSYLNSAPPQVGSSWSIQLQITDLLTSSVYQTYLLSGTLCSSNTQYSVQISGNSFSGTMIPITNGWSGSCQAISTVGVPTTQSSLPSPRSTFVTAASTYTKLPTTYVSKTKISSSPLPISHTKYVSLAPSFTSIPTSTSTPTPTNIGKRESWQDWFTKANIAFILAAFIVLCAVSVLLYVASRKRRHRAYKNAVMKSYESEIYEKPTKVLYAE